MKGLAVRLSVATSADVQLLSYHTHRAYPVIGASAKVIHHARDVRWISPNDDGLDVIAEVPGQRCVVDWPVLVGGAAYSVHDDLCALRNHVRMCNNRRSERNLLENSPEGLVEYPDISS